MTKFDAFCDKMAALPFESKTAIINDLSKEIIPALNDLTEDGMSGIEVYVDFLLTAVAADGKLAEEEYAIIKPLFDAAAEKDTTYDEAVAIFKESGLDNPVQAKKVVDLMVDMIGLVDEKLKYDIVTLCFLVCAIDGEVSKEEKDWIKALVDDNFGLSPIDEIDDFLTKAGVFILGTTDGDQPRMRVLGLKIRLDEKIYFAVGTFKDVYKQLQANPKCEILASVGTEFIRWDGKAVFTDDARLKPIVANMMPDLIKMYDSMGWELGFFSLEGGHAELCNVSNQKEILF